MPKKKAEILNEESQIAITVICPYCNKTNYFNIPEDYFAGFDNKTEESCRKCAKTMIIDLNY